jgi:hypothetical protein
MNRGLANAGNAVQLAGIPEVVEAEHMPDIAANSLSIVRQLQARLHHHAIKLLKFSV